MAVIIPNTDWYNRKSKEKNLSPRCPFANFNLCPRYYQSYSLLGKTGITTKLDKEKDTSLLKRWKRSPYWPVIDEHATAINTVDGVNKSFWNFCPEVSYEVFGYFASNLNKYSDEIDKAATYNCLSSLEQIAPDDWRYNWASVRPLHFSECPLFSLLSTDNTLNKGAEKELIEIKPSVCGVSINLKELFNRIRRWIHSRTHF